MAVKLVEDMFNSEHTKNEKEEVRVQLKINKYGSKDDEDAYRMLEFLKENNINISKHIRYLLALEYQGVLTRASGIQDDVDISCSINSPKDNTDDIKDEISAEEDLDDIGLGFEQDHGELEDESIFD